MQATGQDFDYDPVVAKDITRPWRRKFFPCKDIQNRGAPSKIWDPPKHGLPVKRQAGQKGRRK